MGNKRTVKHLRILLALYFVSVFHCRSHMVLGEEHEEQQEQHASAKLNACPPLQLVPVADGQWSTKLSDPVRLL